MKHLKGQGLAQFKSWLKSKPLTLRFIELMQTGDNQAYFNENHESGAALKETLLDEGWTRIIRNKAAGPAQEFQHPLPATSPSVWVLLECKKFLLLFCKIS